jgi:hypothetical protein
MTLTLSQIHNFRQNESPVLIVGAPRSGTSLLYRILQKHSSFKLHGDDISVNLVESNIFSKPYNLSEPNKLNYLLNKQEIYDKFIAATQGIRQYQNLLAAQFIFRKLYRKEKFSWFRNITWKITLSDLLIATFFSYAKQARGIKRILEKTPSAIYHLPEIKATFPQAKLLFIHRHPLDVFTSYKRRLETSKSLNLKPSELRWLEISAERFCSEYESSIALALKERDANPERFLLIPYAELVNQAEKTIEMVCKFLGEAYEAECLVQNEKQTTSWQIDPHLFGEIQKATKNWQDFIDETEAQWLENRLQDVMLQLGYPRYSISL